MKKTLKLMKIYVPIRVPIYKVKKYDNLTDFNYDDGRLCQCALCITCQLQPSYTGCTQAANQWFYIPVENMILIKNTAYSPHPK